MRVCKGIFVLVTLLAVPALVEAQTQAASPAPPAQAGASAADLAKQLSNPVASLVSVPFQFNWDQPVGPYDDTRFVLNIQPVIPMSLNDDWNLILRWIMPYIGDRSDTPGPSGRLTASAPTRPSGLVEGCGGPPKLQRRRKAASTY